MKDFGIWREISYVLLVPMDFLRFLFLKEMPIRQCLALWPYHPIPHQVIRAIFREMHLKFNVKSGRQRITRNTDSRHGSLGEASWPWGCPGSIYPAHSHGRITCFKKQIGSSQGCSLLILYSQGQWAFLPSDRSQVTLISDSFTVFCYFGSGQMSSKTCARHLLHARIYHICCE